MENYIGTNLKFETTSGLFYGRLREIKKIEGILVFENIIEGKLQQNEVFINDVKNLEIIKDADAGMSKNILEKENTVAEEKFGTNSSSIEKKDVTLAHNNPPPNEKLNITAADIKENKDKEISVLTDEDAKIMLQDAFLNYYPTEEAFLSSVSGGIMKIVTNIFKCKKDDRIAVLIEGNDVFSKLGYILAILMSNSGLKPDVYNKNGITSPDVAQTFQRFTNNGHQHTSLTGQYRVLVVCSNSDRISLKQISYQNVIFTNLSKEYNKENGTKYGLVYGIKTDRVNKFNGRVFCIDVGFTDTFLMKYHLKRNYPSSVFYLPRE